MDPRQSRISRGELGRRGHESNVEGGSRPDGDVSVGGGGIVDVERHFVGIFLRLSY